MNFGFAPEVARGLPAAAVVASDQPSVAASVQRGLSSRTLRLYTNGDVLGVQICGAIKNVMAIAAGVVDSLEMGTNARAALITRGLAEIIRLGDAMGARRETLMGLAGVGDLILTCTDDLSRNRRLGLALGRGDTMEVALRDIGQVVEGYNTAREVVQLAREYRVDMPISEQVYHVLYEGLAPRDAVHNLLSRHIRSESA